MREDESIMRLYRAVKEAWPNGASLDKRADTDDPARSFFYREDNYAWTVAFHVWELAYTHGLAYAQHNPNHGSVVEDYSKRIIRAVETTGIRFIRAHMESVGAEDTPLRIEDYKRITDMIAKCVWEVSEIKRDFIQRCSTYRKYGCA